MFVKSLLDDWEADQDQIFSEWGVGMDEYVEMVAEIKARRVEWANIWAAHIQSRHLLSVEVIEFALDKQGWSFLRPVQPDGTLGQQIDSTDVATVLDPYSV